MKTEPKEHVSIKERLKAGRAGRHGAGGRDEDGPWSQAWGGESPRDGGARHTKP